MEQLGFDSRLTKTAPFQRAIGIGLCTWEFCHVKEEQQGKGGARGPTVKLERGVWFKDVRDDLHMSVEWKPWDLITWSGLCSLSRGWLLAPTCLNQTLVSTLQVTANKNKRKVRLSLNLSDVQHLGLNN
jgi:hypothetical protein